MSENEAVIRTSETIVDLSTAFCKAQMKFGAAIKASQNPAFRSKYADLASVIDATLEHLNAEGIGVMQHPTLTWIGEEEKRTAFVKVTTRLQHISGQWMESDVTIPAVQRDRFDAQSVGSAITYACRYALRSICTVPQADDDANEASGVGSSEAAQKVASTKIAAHRASKGSTDLPEQLTVLKTGEDEYRIQGDPVVMDAHRGLLLAYGERGKENGKPAPYVVMTGEKLEEFKFQFQDQRGGLLTNLKPMREPPGARAHALLNMDPGKPGVEG